MHSSKSWRVNIVLLYTNELIQRNPRFSSELLFAQLQGKPRQLNKSRKRQPGRQRIRSYRLDWRNANTASSNESAILFLRFLLDPNVFLRCPHDVPPLKNSVALSGVSSKYRRPSPSRSPSIGCILQVRS